MIISFKSQFKIFITIVLVILLIMPAQAIIHHKKHNAKVTTSSHSSKIRSHQHQTIHHVTHATKARRIVQARPRYAYPISIFLYHPPAFDSSPLSQELSTSIRKAFSEGYANDYPTRSLVKAGIVTYYPLRGGIFWRREPIKYIIMHSTEPGISVGARTIIDGWSHGGRRHAGAHYVVERDGTIYQALDPDLAAVHVNIFKTLPGINNDNSIGIEMCHCGSQDYPYAQLQSVVKLTAYLQSHYHVADNYVITHRYAQQGDHTDPVNFSWDNFIAEKSSVQNQGLHNKMAYLKTEAIGWQQLSEPIVPNKIVFQTTTTKTVSIKPNRSETKPVASSPEPRTNLPITTSTTTSTTTTVTRLMPAGQTTKLVPVSMIINNPRSSDTVNQPVIIPIIKSNISARVLPLKGPIEMDPDAAASLLSQ